MRSRFLLALVVLALSAACTEPGPPGPPEGTVKIQFDATTQVTWYVISTGPGDCYDVIAEAPTGARSKWGGGGCVEFEHEEPLQELAAGGFPVRDAGNFQFVIGKPFPGATIVRLTFLNGSIRSDTRPEPVWFVVFPSNSVEVTKYEALNRAGDVLFEQG